MLVLLHTIYYLLCHKNQKRYEKVARDELFILLSHVAFGIKSNPI